MKSILAFAVLLALSAVVLSAADITGTWKGSFEYNGENVPVTLNLKASGETVSGNIEGLPTSPAKIEDGKLQGEAVTFWIMIDYQGMAVKLVYKGKLSGNEIKFDFGTEDGAWGTQLTTKRA
jgi:hypothetical protein